MRIIRIGLDISKHVFQAHGVDEAEQPVLRRQLRRGEMVRFFGKQAPTLVGLEACGSSHYWARCLRRLGHQVVLVPPQYVKPYVQHGKNDAIDAAAICEAMGRPGMRFVAVKSAEDQAGLMLLKVRDLLVRHRTAIVNAMRGHAGEFGVIARKGRHKAADLLQRALAPEAGLPELAGELLRLLADQLAAIETKLEAIEAKLMAQHRHDPISQCLATQPGIGPIAAVSFRLKVPDPTAFRSGRHFAAWLGCRRRRTRPAAAAALARSAGRATRVCAGCWCSAPRR